MPGASTWSRPRLALEHYSLAAQHTSFDTLMGIEAVGHFPDGSVSYHLLFAASGRRCLLVDKFRRVYAHINAIHGMDGPQHRMPVATQQHYGAVSSFHIVFQTMSALVCKCFDPRPDRFDAEGDRVGSSALTAEWR